MSGEAQLCYFFGLLFSSLLNSHLQPATSVQAGTSGEKVVVDTPLPNGLSLRWTTWSSWWGVTDRLRLCSCLRQQWREFSSNVLQWGCLASSFPTFLMPPAHPQTTPSPHLPDVREVWEESEECLCSSGSRLPVKLGRISTCAENSRTHMYANMYANMSKYSEQGHPSGNESLRISLSFLYGLALSNLCVCSTYCPLYPSVPLHLLHCWRLDMLDRCYHFTFLYKAWVNNTDVTYCQHAASLTTVSVVHWWMMDFLLKKECQKCPCRSLYLWAHCV